jgi:hypothetical protein
VKGVNRRRGLYLEGKIVDPLGVRSAAAERGADAINAKLGRSRLEEGTYAVPVPVQTIAKILMLSASIPC